MGRIYIPEEDLARTNLSAANFSAAALQDPLQAQQLRPALEYEAERARKYYESAKWLMELIEEDSRAALWVLVEIYSQLLQKITDRNYDVFTERVRLTLWEKLKVLSARTPAPHCMNADTQQKTVAIVGGGLCRAWRQAARWPMPDCKSRCFERWASVRRRPSLFLRAYIRVRARVVWITCQHVLLGCCTNLIHFYERMGVSGKNPLV